MLVSTRGKGDFIILTLKPEDIFRAAAYLYKSLKRGSLSDYCFHNVTDGLQFRIEVRK